MDYCLSGRKADDVQPILVARDQDTTMNVSSLVQTQAWWATT